MASYLLQSGQQFRARLAKRPSRPSFSTVSQRNTAFAMLKNIPGFRTKDPSTEGSAKEQEQSLTTVLSTREDRTNLLLLVADCTESLRKATLDTFDPNEVGDSEETTIRSSAEVPKDELALKADGQGTPTTTAEDAAKDAAAEAKAHEEAEERAKKDLELRIKELDGPQMKELKQAALDHLDEWRERVLARVGEAVNSTDGEQEATAKKTSSKPVQSGDKKVTPPPSDEDVNEALRELYPPHDTPLRKLDQAKRVLILHSLLLLLLGLESYQSQSRVLLLHITSSLGLPLEVLARDEEQVAKGLLEAAKQQMNADEETKQKAEANKNSRRWKVGLGAVAGAALIGVTGGLAAPLLAAGIGSVMGGLGLGATAAAGYLGALAGSAPLIGVLFGAYGGRMTGQMVDSYAKEVEDFAFIPVRKTSRFSTAESESNMRRLRVAIGISGWLTEEGTVTKPWNIIGHRIEAFSLRWELEALLKLGNAITTYVKSAAWGFAKSQIIKHTVFAALTAALWPLGILKAARLVDNPFSVARSRSEKAGRVLADALINKVQGERPVTLIGYSMGARVIYTCLDELANRRAFGLVESVVLAGAPVPADSVSWRRIRSVVAGRVVNVYSTNDYLLAFLYRSTSMQYGVAGLSAITGVKGVENVDVSELVDGHTQYRFLTGRVLKKIGFEDLDAAEAEKQEKQLEAQQREDEQDREKNEKKKVEVSSEDPDAEVDQMEKELAKKNQAAKAMDRLSSRVAKATVAAAGDDDGSVVDQVTDAAIA